METDQILAEVNRLSYDGNGIEDAIRFIRTHERVYNGLKSFGNSNWSKAYVNIFLGGLVKQAADWKNDKFLTVMVATTEEWFKFFRDEFIPLTYDRTLYKRLQSLKENGKTRNYCDKFRQIEYLIEDKQDWYLDKLFEEGLSTNSRDLCITRGVQTRSECIEFLKKLRNREDIPAPVERIAENRGTKRKSSFANAYKERSDSIKCYGCGNSGHYKRNCPERRQWEH
ncbi:uncharacterized protein PRCAT00004358001 [Priceomyces carsonii]|uniref:uncharacterized protein n=1 Tax=Priceomyces carsonii TaxID=28549 RepID=UPI002ED808C9|nr:unnamed protein product [Priceomyces carsonii]